MLLNNDTKRRKVRNKRHSLVNVEEKVEEMLRKILRCDILAIGLDIDIGLGILCLAT